MNIDERIEVLTQSVELLSLMHQNNEKRYNQIFEQLVRMNERLVDIEITRIASGVSKTKMGIASELNASYASTIAGASTIGSSISTSNPGFALLALMRP